MDDQTKRTAAEHGEKSRRRTGPKQEARPEDLYQVKVDDQKKRTAAGTARTVTGPGHVLLETCESGLRVM